MFMRVSCQVRRCSEEAGCASKQAFLGWLARPRPPHRPRDVSDPLIVSCEAGGAHASGRARWLCIGPFPPRTLDPHPIRFPVLLLSSEVRSFLRPQSWSNTGTTPLPPLPRRPVPRLRPGMPLRSGLRYSRLCSRMVEPPSRVMKRPLSFAGSQLSVEPIEVRLQRRLRGHPGGVVRRSDPKDAATGALPHHRRWSRRRTTLGRRARPRPNRARRG